MTEIPKAKTVCHSYYDDENSYMCPKKQTGGHIKRQPIHEYISQLRLYYDVCLFCSSLIQLPHTQRDQTVSFFLFPINYTDLYCSIVPISFCSVWHCSLLVMISHHNYFSWRSKLQWTTLLSVTAPVWQCESWDTLKARTIVKNVVKLSILAGIMYHASSTSLKGINQKGGIVNHRIFYD